MFLGNHFAISLFVRRKPLIGLLRGHTLDVFLGVGRLLATVGVQEIFALGGPVQRFFVAGRIADAAGSVSGEDGGTAQTFAVVTLTKGQILTGELGCEVMLRVGSAVCVADSNPGLVDETGGSTLAGGKELVKNHLYMMTIEGRGVKAAADTVKLIIQNTYTVA